MNLDIFMDHVRQGEEEGLKVYGKFDAKTDKRDLRKESFKELRDAYFYILKDNEVIVLAINEERDDELIRERFKHNMRMLVKLEDIIRKHYPDTI